MENRIQNSFDISCMIRQRKKKKKMKPREKYLSCRPRESQPN